MLTRDMEAAFVDSDTPSAATRVMLAGGAPLVQTGLEAVLTQDAGLQLVDKVLDAGEGMTRAQQMACDVLVLYVDRPQVELSPIVERLATEPAGASPGARTQVLVLTEDESRDALLTALRLGVRGYGIVTELPLDALCAGIRRLPRGEVWLCPLALRHLVATAVGGELGPGADSRRPRPRGHGPLSEREVEVLHLAAQQAGEETIAEALHISRSTVKTYLRRICEKLDAPSRADAIRQAIACGLIPDRRRTPRQSPA
ncbi:MAG: LuxR C-terminal-related transcriptional regulator [Chloroflexota bacterium]